MRRFLVDGERLSHLNPKLLNEEVVSGIDDVIGIGLLNRLDTRLEYARRGALRDMTPKDQEETLEKGLEMLEECGEELERERGAVTSGEEGQIDFRRNQRDTGGDREALNGRR